MATWDSYTQKATPEDNDTLMIKDTAGGANKRTPFSGVWNWIVKKLASAVISQLETTNKSIIPAINELNSKTKIQRINYNTNETGNYVQIILDDNNVIQFQTIAGNPNRINISLKVDGEWGDIIYLNSES